jgi:GNAT superfamily N-acetyltransferase
MVNITSKKPEFCSKKELRTFESLVSKGGEVIKAGLSHRILKAEKLIFLFEEDGVLSGIAALKKPDPVYKKKVFDKAGSAENNDQFTFEVGWIFVEEKFRRKKYSQLLLKHILKLAGKNKIYATTREDNVAMNKTNSHLGLELSGHSYKSDKGDHNLVLYIKQ